MSFFKFSTPVYFSQPTAEIPKQEITNERLIDLMGVKLKPAWIEKRTGIQKRYWVNDESCSDLAFGACKSLFNKYSIKPDEIEALMLATISGDYQSPPTAPFLQHRLGLSVDVGCMDVGAACSGFVTGLISAGNFVANLDKDILLVASEIRSKFLDTKDFTTSVLFGDGAAATKVSKSKEGNQFQLLAAEMLADGSVADIISIPSGGSRSPVTAENLDENKLRMKSGSELFIKATNGMHESAVNLLKRLNLTTNDIAWVVPHQANLHMIHLIAQRLEFPLERVSQTVKKWGNTSGASVGMALSDLKIGEDVKSGDKVLLISAGGGGLTANAVIQVL